MMDGTYTAMTCNCASTVCTCFGPYGPRTVTAANVCVVTVGALYVDDFSDDLERSARIRALRTFLEEQVEGDGYFKPLLILQIDGRPERRPRAVPDVRGPPHASPFLTAVWIERNGGLFDGW